MATKTCLVSVIDHGGMRHSAEVSADTLYEAAAKGLRALRDHGWVPHAQLSRSRLEIEVREPAKLHRIRLDRFESWIETSGAVGPKEFMKKARIRELLYAPVETAPTSSRNRS